MKRIYFPLLLLPSKDIVSTNVQVYSASPFTLAKYYANIALYSVSFRSTLWNASMWLNRVRQRVKATPRQFFNSSVLSSLLVYSLGNKFLLLLPSQALRPLFPNHWKNCALHEILVLYGNPGIFSITIIELISPFSGWSQLSSTYCSLCKNII